ncbi:SET domain-containing protein [Obba rivulosa]|uniref:SET domain-containing protein n=1 Tax=Obba rivulosa TaxID=1052685 RepID=A0A8E2AYC5_9APHY|nr:SET domain-containing protein [Obba rivulosa]
MAFHHGFGVISWKTDRKQVVRKFREFAQTGKLAEDIPHELQDRINALPAAARRADRMQVKLFEAAIAENTADDEPNAPPIRVINEIDDELTPPYEFHYSNLLWHGPGVPLPDEKNLVGCDCIGPCDPLSKTCACVQRQQQECDFINGFLYDARGRLRVHEYPIFECNAMCGCSEDCINRVVQHGRKHAIIIQKTQKKGWGVFAGNKRIPAHTFVGIYAGEYITDEEGEKRGKQYNKFGRTYLFDVDFWYLKSHLDNPNEWDVKYLVDAYHVGNFTRYLNHSCDPNCFLNPCYINESNIDKPLLAIFTLRDVEPGEELCFSYYGLDDEDEGNKTFSKDDAVYVKCECGAKKCRGRMWRDATP